MCDEKSFEKLRATFSQENKLEMLTEFSSLISEISFKFIYGVDNTDNLNSVLNIVKGQRNITDISESFFEYLQSDNFEVSKADEYVDQLKEACEWMTKVSQVTNKTEISQENDK